MGALLMSEPVIDVLRRELRRVSPAAKIDETEIRNVLVAEVFRREVFEGEKAEAAKKLVARAAHRTLRSTKTDAEPEPSAGTPPAE
jgi:hypothetical protein